MSIIESANGVGARLAEARSEQGMSVEDLSSRTYIRPGVIRGIENDDFAACGGPFYARGHIRTLARTLGIDDALAARASSTGSTGRPSRGSRPRPPRAEPVSRAACPAAADRPAPPAVARAGWPSPPSCSS